MKKHGIVCGAVALFVGFGVGMATAREPLRVSIDHPADGTYVPWRPCFTGSISDPDAKVWLILHVKGGDYFVQPRISNKGQTWSALPYVAENKPGLFEGAQFEAKAVANPLEPLAEGQILGDFPRGEAESPLIDVVRRDNAPDGCAVAGVPAALIGAATVPSVNVATPPSEIQAVDWKSDLLRWGIAFGTFLFLVMAALPSRAQEAIDALVRWCGVFGKHVWRFCPQAWKWIADFSGNLWTGCMRRASNQWRRTGFTGSHKAFVLEVVTLLFFFPLAIPGVYTEAKSIRAGFGLMFPGATAADRAGANSGLLAHRSNSDPRPEAPAAGSTGPVSAVIDMSMDLWRRDDLMVMSIGLAALQAAFGIILWRSMTEKQALEHSIISLFRQRPIPAFFFIVMDLAVTLMAALRGFESSPDVDWRLPTAVAASIAFAMPWLLGYIAFITMEALSNCGGPLVAALFSGVLIVGAAAAQAGWAVILALALAAQAIALAALGLFSVVACGFLYFAKATGELLRKISGFRRFPGPPKDFPANLS